MKDIICSSGNESMLQQYMEDEQQQQHTPSGSGVGSISKNSASLSSTLASTGKTEMPRRPPPVTSTPVVQSGRGELHFHSASYSPRMLTYSELMENGPEVARLIPNPMEDSQNVYSPNTKVQAEADIEMFFNQPILPQSPVLSEEDSFSSVMQGLAGRSPGSPIISGQCYENINLEESLHVDFGTSTILSFSTADLPREVEDMLKPYVHSDVLLSETCETKGGNLNQRKRKLSHSIDFSDSNANSNLSCSSEKENSKEVVKNSSVLSGCENAWIVSKDQITLYENQMDDMNTKSEFQPLNLPNSPNLSPIAKPQLNCKMAPIFVSSGNEVTFKATSQQLDVDMSTNK